MCDGIVRPLNNGMVHKLTLEKEKKKKTITTY